MLQAPMSSEALTTVLPLEIANHDLTFCKRFNNAILNALKSHMIPKNETSISPGKKTLVVLWMERQLGNNVLGILCGVC